MTVWCHQGKSFYRENLKARLNKFLGINRIKIFVKNSHHLDLLLCTKSAKNLEKLALKLLGSSSLQSIINNKH